MLTPILINRISPPSLDDFDKLYVRRNQPVIITGLLEQWPASSLWSLSYFSKSFGETKAKVIGIQKGTCAYQGVPLDLAPLRDSIASIQAEKADDGVAIASPVELFPETLRNDYFLLPYCKGKKFLSCQIWIGPKGMVTALHQDLPENLYVLVKGRKQITIFPPSSPVYPNSRFSKIPHYAQANPDKPDYERFPNFMKAQPYVIDLCAGETLFLPSFWWHHLRNTEASIAMNFWWSQGWKTSIAWTASIYKKLRKM
jgi:hypothetical protein